LIVVVMGCLLSSAVSEAHAGTYDVWACRLPNGAPTEVDGWSRGADAAGSLMNTCNIGGALAVGLNWSDVEHWAEASWMFAAPSATEIDNFSLVRAVGVGGDRQYLLYRDFASAASWPPARTWAETCISWWGPCTSLGLLAVPWAPQNRVEYAGLTGTVGLTIALDCQPRSSQVCPVAMGEANGYVNVWSSRIGLKDTLDPELTAPPTGSLLSGQPVSEIQYVTFKATTRAEASSRWACSSTACRTVTGSSIPRARRAGSRTRRSCRAR
jgi:hypothetical protein